MADLKDILSSNDGPISDDELLKYLSENVPEEEKHLIEKKVAGSSFDNDALEGLQQFKNRDSLVQTVQQINKSLQQQLADKKHIKEKRRIKEIPVLLFAAIIILLICIIGYAVIHLYNKNKKQKELPGKEVIAIRKAYRF